MNQREFVGETPRLVNGAAVGSLASMAQRFHPHPLIRQGDVQTLLSMQMMQAEQPVTVGEQPIVLDGGVDRTGMDLDRSVRLLAYYTAQRTSGPRRGLVLTLHGWEGCAHSHYNLLTGSLLIAKGYDVVRLNFRDHGDTHHLNKGLFYSTLIEEVQHAAEQVAAWLPDEPFYVVGASLGGSFALRLAIRWDREHFPNLRRVVSVNPAVNPNHTADVLDRQPLYRHYFRKRWLASLRRKSHLFPDIYGDLGALDSMVGMREMTDWLVRRYSPYPNAEEYFDAYSVKNGDLRDLSIPTAIITAANDPIISVDDFYKFDDHPLLDLQIHPSGGHVGFVDLFPFRHVLPEMILGQIERNE
ncbi:MAG: alpha/beta fold hydrolase [Caldilineaceae bacterium]|nr:alpha/beta fold hydrolase [Caldilineaceae bacterium]